MENVLTRIDNRIEISDSKKYIRPRFSSNLVYFMLPILAILWSISFSTRHREAKQAARMDAINLDAEKWCEIGAAFLREDDTEYDLLPATSPNPGIVSGSSVENLAHETDKRLMLVESRISPRHSVRTTGYRSQSSFPLLDSLSHTHTHTHTRFTNFFPSMVWWFDLVLERNIPWDIMVADKHLIKQLLIGYNTNNNKVDFLHKCLRSLFVDLYPESSDHETADAQRRRQ